MHEIDPRKIGLFLRRKSEPDTFRPYKGATFCPPPFDLTPAAIADAEVEPALAANIAAACAGRRPAFLLTGGINSSTLVAIAREIIPTPVCYAADMGAGGDLGYARRVARALGVELREVAIDYGEADLDRHRRATRATGYLIPLNGNFVGVSGIAERAKRDGFDLLVEGTGGGEIYGGSLGLQGPGWIRAMRQRGELGRIGALKAWQGKGARYRQRAWTELLLRSRTASSWLDTQRWMLTRTVPRWTMELDAISRTFGIDIRSPMLEGAAPRYAMNDAAAFFVQGVPKHQLRAILGRSVGQDIAMQPDDQGFRLPVGRLLRATRPAMERVIARHFAQVRRFYPGFFAFRHLALQGHVVRAYAVAILMDALANPAVPISGFDETVARPSGEAVER